MLPRLVPGTIFVRIKNNVIAYSLVRDHLNRQRQIHTVKHEQALKETLQTYMYKYEKITQYVIN